MSFNKDQTLTPNPFNIDIRTGLTLNQVLVRKEKGLTNKQVTVPTKTVGRIIRDNLFTLFNLVNLILATAIIYVGSYKNLLFLGVIIANILIGTLQEIKAKKSVDSLSILSAKKIKALRDGKEVLIEIEEIVLDDILILETGHQIPSDCMVVDGECEVNESLLTGESNSINKKANSKLLSGSFVVSGMCKAKVSHVAEDNYAFKISKDAKYLKKVNSDILNTFKRIILIVSIIILPVGIALFLHQLTQNGVAPYDKLIVESAVLNTAAALIGMIPEGLVLLTSTVLAVSVIRLSKYKVLVQELYCIETLARVDTLCLDKTGTITEGTMVVEQILPYRSTAKEELIGGLSLIANGLKDKNSTINAIREYLKNFPCQKLTPKSVRPFSSELKWSGVCFAQKGSYILGAPEIVLKDQLSAAKEALKNINPDYRVLVLLHSNNLLETKDLPQNMQILGFVAIKDKIRNEAKKTLEYFKNEGVNIKIISGDSVETISTVAKLAGVGEYQNFVDMSSLPKDSNLKEIVENYAIFGRVSPNQKKDIIKELKALGHTVAMVGDGVNDVLALKESDCGVAMASGSQAAKNVSQLVLLNSNFDSMPKVVLEGRRTINNIQRSSSLFLVKTIYSTLLAILLLFINMPYPFSPIQLSLLSVLTIGIPSFILALGPNKNRIRGNLFVNIISKALPAGLTTVIAILLAMLFTWLFKIPYAQSSTMCVILTAYIGFFILYDICLPFNTLKEFLFISLVVGFFVATIFFKDFLSLVILSFSTSLILIFLLALCTLLLTLSLKYKKHNRLLHKH